MQSLVQHADKGSIRRQFLQARAELTVQQRAERSRRICSWLAERLGQALRDGPVRTVGLYAAFRGEADLQAFAEAARDLGVRTAYPKAEPATQTMHFAGVVDESRLQPGAYGIREPQCDLPGCEAAVEPDELDWLFVPGVAFTADGKRLGYGGGYYDRFLPRTRALRIGVCFACQVANGLPQGGWDQRMDVMVTEEGILSCADMR